MQPVLKQSFDVSIPFIVKNLGVVEYFTAWQNMKAFTQARTPHTSNEIWLLQHPPVFTQGIAGKPEHLLCQNDIAVIKTDRGGQITYHGPGQIIAYLLLDMRRLGIGVRELVRSMESAVVDLLQSYQVSACGRIDAPGVYVGAAKIASLGLKIRKNYCYHGIALNVDMDLTPFSYINPCGYRGLQVTQTRDQGITDGCDALGSKLAHHLQHTLLKGKTHSS